MQLTQLACALFLMIGFHAGLGAMAHPPALKLPEDGEWPAARKIMLAKFEERCTKVDLAIKKLEENPNWQEYESFSSTLLVVARQELDRCRAIRALDEQMYENTQERLETFDGRLNAVKLKLEAKDAEYLASTKQSLDFICDRRIPALQQEPSKAGMIVYLGEIREDIARVETLERELESKQGLQALTLRSKAKLAQSQLMQLEQDIIAADRKSTENVISRNKTLNLLRRCILGGIAAVAIATICYFCFKKPAVATAR